jgi:hypothetical protein
MEVGLVAERSEQCNSLVCPSVVDYLFFTPFHLNIIAKRTFLPFDTSSVSA